MKYQNNIKPNFKDYTTMKNKIFSLILLIPILFTGCDNLFDKGDVEKSYEGPDQIAFFPLEDNNNLGVNVTSTTIEVQLISEDGLAKSDIAVNFSRDASSTAAAGTDYSFGTPSPVTISAGEASTTIQVNFVVTTVDGLTEISSDAGTVAGEYTGVAATGGAGTGATFDVTVSEYGLVSSVDSVSVTADSVRTVGTYSGVTATGMQGSGATFDVVIAEYGEIQSVDSLSAYDAARTAGTYNAVSATGGSGTESFFNVAINDTGLVSSVTVLLGGSKYVAGEVLTIAAADIGGTGADLTFQAGEVSAYTTPTVAIADAGTRYAVNDTLTIAAADIGGTGTDLTFTTTASALGAPSLTIVSGGTGYAAGDVLTIAAADIGAAGAALTFEVSELTGSFTASEVLLMLNLDATTGVEIAENLKSTNIFMAK